MANITNVTNETTFLNAIQAKLTGIGVLAGRKTYVTKNAKALRIALIACVIICAIGIAALATIFTSATMPAIVAVVGCVAAVGAIVFGLGLYGHVALNLYRNKTIFDNLAKKALMRNEEDLSDLPKIEWTGGGEKYRMGPN